MTRFDSNSYTEAELVAEFDALFPQGFAGPDVLAEIAPAGWEQSPLFATFHPSAQQVYHEVVQTHRNISALRRPGDERPEPPEPTLEEVTRDFKERPIETEREVRELVGQCLWDVFCENHDVIAGGGRVLDLGSFRAGGGFLAELLNRQIKADQYDYLDFYMGTIWVAQRADLTPVYQMIFRRMQNRGLDWSYRFPRLYAVDLRPLKEALDRKDEPEWLNYSPSESLAEEQQESERDKEMAELRESLDAGYRDAVEDAMKHPPPTTVRAYQAVFGHDPRGWPPEPT